MKYPGPLQQWSIQPSYLSPTVEPGETIWAGWHSPQLPSTQNGYIWDVRIKMYQLNLLVLYGDIIHAVT